MLGGFDSSTGLGGQILALIDVPEDFPVGIYDVDVLIRRRVLPGPTGSEDEPYFDVDIGPIRVLEGPPAGVEARTPDAGFTSTFQSDPSYVRRDLRSLVPNPKLIVTLNPSGQGLMPAATELTVSYDAQKLRVIGAVEGYMRSTSGSMILCDGCSNPVDDSVCLAGPGTADVTIQMVDPSRSIRALGIVFKLCDSEALGRATLEDFQIVSAYQYDDQGEPMSIAPAKDSIR